MPFSYPRLLAQAGKLRSSTLRVCQLLTGGPALWQPQGLNCWASKFRVDTCRSWIFLKCLPFLKLYDMLTAINTFQEEVQDAGLLSEVPWQCQIATPQLPIAGGNADLQRKKTMNQQTALVVLPFCVGMMIHVPWRCSQSQKFFNGHGCWNHWVATIAPRHYTHASQASTVLSPTNSSKPTFHTLRNFAWIFNFHPFTT